MPWVPAIARAPGYRINVSGAGATVTYLLAGSGAFERLDGQQITDLDDARLAAHPNLFTWRSPAPVEDRHVDGVSFDPDPLPKTKKTKR